MKQSLGKKICAIGVGLIILFVVLNIILTYFFLRPFSTYLSTKQMEKLAQTFLNLDSYQDDEFVTYIESIDEDMNTQVTIVDEKQNIICTTRVRDYHENKIGSVTSQLLSDNMQELEAGHVVSLSRTKEETGKVNVRVIQKVAKNRYVILFRSYSSLKNATTVSIIFDAIVGIIIVVFSIWIIYCVSRSLIIPLRDMTETAEHIANLEFDRKVIVRSEDELGQLGKSINRMSQQLEENLEMLQEDIKNRKRLVRNLSHEIKSPVAVIMGYADRMKAVIEKNPEKAAAYCGIISEESGRIDSLMKEMLDFSRLEQRTEGIDKDWISAGDFFGRIRKHFEEENIGRQIVYEENYTATDTLYADTILLERAVDNLLRNAVTYGEQEKLRIRIMGEREEKYYKIRVFNSGSYIAPEDCAAIWDAFCKVDKARTRGNRGSGVGLSIVREIVEAHEGYYGVENIEDGVEFTIAFKI